MNIERGPRAPSIHPAGLSRRRFVQGIALAGVAGVAGRSRADTGMASSPGVLSGTEFDLDIAPAAVNFTGRRSIATVINGLLPAPLLRWREGDTVRIRVSNHLAEPTSIHWHGMLVPAAMDGVPGFSFPGILPGGSFEYRFRVRQAGTYWYHSHSGHQEQTGVYGPLVVLPRDADPDGVERDHVVMLSDWSDEDPRRIVHRLKVQGDYYNHGQRTVGDFFRDIGRDGLGATLADRIAWGGMRMTPTDLADVGGGAYTYLMNGTTPAGNWTGLFRPGERVRLRFINAGAMTYFDVRIPGLPMTVIAADGQPVEQVTVEEFRIGPGETLDVVVAPPDAEAYTVFAQSMDRSGFARGTLAPRPGMSAAVPAPDPRPLLTMADMGHGGHAAADPHAGHAGHEGHEGHTMPGAAAPQAHAATEFGPTVDMRAEAPSTRLDDPGVGLRDNGRRVLTYADLASRFADPDGRDPGRTLELHLTGHMGRYIWSFDGVPYADAGPLRFAYGERLRIRLVNDTMMEHPMHLHGMWSDLEDESGAFKLRKHTVSIKPGHALSYRISADALGRWAYHCHLMLHMTNGMFREVIVDEESRHG
ncbi:MAG: copper resistance system multicopper oxidase [Gammaproteobacteria bacterium]|nr:MAG: copper resistance system multicopper oxidase [Gammaproteobacteria bacterium]